MLPEHHREAMFHIALVRGIAQNALANDGDPEESERCLIGYKALLAALGLKNGKAISERVAELRAAVSSLEEAAKDMIERNPRARD